MEVLGVEPRFEESSLRRFFGPRQSNRRIVDSLEMLHRVDKEAIDGTNSGEAGMDIEDVKVYI
jgi:hypothetical protein